MSLNYHCHLCGDPITDDEDAIRDRGADSWHTACATVFVQDKRVSVTNGRRLTDTKAALGNTSKPDITHCRTSTMVYIARACEYGAEKYERANFLRPTPDRTADFVRFRAYLRAAVSHLVLTLDSMERHQSQDPQLVDVDALPDAAYAPDTDATPGAPVGASGLPHVAHALASLNMAVQQAIDAGILPADPGRPWEK